MIHTWRQAGARAAGAAAALLVLLGLALQSDAGAQDEAQRPRPGLTAKQTEDAVRLAKGAMVELRKKTEGAQEAGADTREYIVGVELLAATARGATAKKPAADTKEGEPARPPADDSVTPESQEKERGSGPLALVTSYRYFDDITVFSMVDLGTRRVVKVEAAQHLRTPLSDAEFEEASAMRERSEPVKQLYERFGDQIEARPQFSQFAVKDDPRIHRVVHLTYRVGKRDLSYPRPTVDLTTREVETPAPPEQTAPKAAPKRSR